MTIFVFLYIIHLYIMLSYIILYYIILYVYPCILSLRFYIFQNGLWASVGWCVLLFLPCVVLSLVLASLYRKTDPYPGSLVET